jgi:hypothetical protein
MLIRRVPGAVGSRLARSFTRASSERIRYGHLAPISGAAQVVIACWIYPVDSVTYDFILSHMETAEFNGIGIQHNANDASSLFLVARNGSNSPYHQYSASTLTLNAWNHVVMQYDGTQGTAADRVRAYVNGGSVLTPASSSGTFPTTLGTYSSPPEFTLAEGVGRYWSGRLADVATWVGVTLTDDERRALAMGASPSGIRASALVLHDTLTGIATNRVTGVAATVTGSTFAMGPPNLQAPPTLRRLAIGTATTLDTIRPSGTASAGSWTAQPSGTLHGVTSDESDSTAARSSAGAGSDTLDLSFPAMGTPDAGTVTFYIRHQRT